MRPVWEGVVVITVPCFFFFARSPAFQVPIFTQASLFLALFLARNSALLGERVHGHEVLRDRCMVMTVELLGQPGKIMGMIAFYLRGRGGKKGGRNTPNHFSCFRNRT